MENTRRAEFAENEARIKNKGKYKKQKVKDYQIILMIITLVIAVFVVIQLIHMINYTIGNEIDVNKMWLYKWVLNLNG